MGRRDDAEFEAFVAARSSQLRRVAFMIVRDWQHAEDMVQTALANLYVAWPRVRREALNSYASRAVVNVSISWMRKRRPEVLTGSIPERTATSQFSSSDEDLLSALEKLTTSQAAIVALRYVEDLSVADVANMLNVSEGTVKSQSSRALAHLRRLLVDIEPATE